MPASNTSQSFGSVTRVMHWLTALLIITAIPLGFIANRLPYDTSAALAQKAQLFSLHKTLGVAAFIVAGLRILWALTQTHPVPLHPERRAETTLASVIHWLLYISMLVVPLSGWVHHAATSGFAPILWPFGQDLPLVPKSESLAHLAASMHWVFTKLLAASIFLHLAGAVKHHIIDKDATLRRMLSGTIAPEDPIPDHGSKVLPLAAALLIYAAGAGLALTLAGGEAPATTTLTPPAASSAGNWQVAEGSLAISVKQLKSDVAGQFSNWTADINFDEATGQGDVTVTIDTTSLSLGSVTKQAQGAEFLDTANFGTAIFKATIAPNNGAYSATGTISLHGTEAPLTLPFILEIVGDQATMTGSTTLDRRDFKIGEAYPDESSVGFEVTISVDLKANRSAP